MKKINFLIVLLSVFVCVLFSNASQLDFSSPEATFRSNMQSCKLSSFELSDQCYTKAFQRFQKADPNYLKYRHPRQLANAYRYWANKPYKLEMYGNKAIMRFSPEFKRPEPFYFVKENGKWKIDGLFSIRNVKIQDANTWYWKNSKIDNERIWINSK